ncbi:YceI family protein [Psychroflexus salis]|uniref:Lipid-binding protein n=1 Tax=Psychroflexus salis TaxID=1526574 RepID=A0A917EC23_9FLAO|nr:YceI family protein [Psychroflexus salis]GGE19972.1 lipid-binding protein [Psychroflexus salis]
MKMNVLKGIFATAIVAVIGFTTANAQEKVNIKESQIKWVGEKLTGSHDGTIDLKSGYFLMEGGELVGGEFIVDMTTINVTDLEGDSKSDLEGHLNSDDFFGVSNHKTAKFVINTAAKKGNTYGVSGTLTIKGKSNPIAFDLDMANGKANTTLKIDRTKYDIKYGSGSFFDNLGDKTIYDEFTLMVNLNY